MSTNLTREELEKAARKENAEEAKGQIEQLIGDVKAMAADYTSLVNVHRRFMKRVKQAGIRVELFDLSGDRPLKNERAEEAEAKLAMLAAPAPSTPQTLDAQRLSRKMYELDGKLLSPGEYVHFAELALAAIEQAAQRPEPQGVQEWLQKAASEILGETWDLWDKQQLDQRLVALAKIAAIILKHLSAEPQGDVCTFGCTEAQYDLRCTIHKPAAINLGDFVNQTLRMWEQAANDPVMKGVRFDVASEILRNTYSVKEMSPPADKAAQPEGKK